MNILENAFVALALSAPIFMIANMVGGVLLAEIRGEFNAEIMKQSAIKYVGLLIMAGLLYVGGLLANTGIKEVLDVDLQLAKIVMIGIATFGLAYAYQAIEKFNTITGVKIKEEQE